VCYRNLVKEKVLAHWGLLRPPPQKKKNFLYSNEEIYVLTINDLDVELTLRVLMSYIYGAPILDVSRSHTTTQHSR